jgi:hypothetical protein
MFDRIFRNWQTTVAGTLGGSLLWVSDALSSGQVVTLKGFLSFCAVQLLGAVCPGKTK